MATMPPNDYYYTPVMPSHPGYGTSTASDAVDVADINTFLCEYKQQRRQPNATGSSHASATHYQQTTYHESSPWPPAPSDTSASEITRSTRTHTTQPSACFDYDRYGGHSRSVMSGSTETDAPDLSEIPPDQFGAYHPLPMYNTNENTQVLRCEFSIYNGCAASFSHDEVLHWIDHTVQHFEPVGLPAVCLCLYCDTWIFEAAARPDGDERMNFQNRMLHISGHLGDRIDRKERIDPWVLDHLWQNKMISKDIFNRERNRHEAPQIPGLLPAGAKSSRQLQREESNNRVYHDMPREETRRRRRRHKK